jgi:hypothetical protein
MTMQKNIFLLFLFLPLQAMEIVSLLEKNYVEQHEQDKKCVEIGIRVPAKHKVGLYALETQKKVPQCREKCACIAKGAGLGGCCFFDCGGTGMYCYSLGDFCLWLCFKNYHFTPITVLNEIMCYGLPVCTCAGCIVGACCVVTGLSTKMKIDDWFK